MIATITDKIEKKEEEKNRSIILPFIWSIIEHVFLFITIIYPLMHAKAFNLNNRAYCSIRWWNICTILKTIWNEKNARHEECLRGCEYLPTHNTRFISLMKCIMRIWTNKKKKTSSENTLECFFIIRDNGNVANGEKWRAIDFLVIHSTRFRHFEISYNPHCNENIWSSLEMCS